MIQAVIRQSAAVFMKEFHTPGQRDEEVREIAVVHFARRRETIHPRGECGRLMHTECLVRSENLGVLANARGGNELKSGGIIHARAANRFDELMKLYAPVVDINAARLPSPK